MTFLFLYIYSCFVSPIHVHPLLRARNQQAFNDTVDLLLSLKAQWRISSTDLRERVQGQLNLEIMESYTNFFEKYSSVNFSKKNKDSYLRYPPSKVEVVLSEFFG